MTANGIDPMTEHDDQILAKIEALNKKVDFLINCVVALSGEQNDRTNMLRNYVEGQSDHEARIARLERRTTTPCPPPGEAA